MLHSAARARALTLTLGAGISLAILGGALPASAAVPTGPVTVSGLVASQSASVVTVDLDYVGDATEDGTVTVLVYTYATCSTFASTLTDQFLAAAGASGHYTHTFPIAANNRTQVEVDRTDGSSSVYDSSNFVSDPSAPHSLTATIVPDADPSTGQVQLSSGVEHWSTDYDVKIDGVSTLPYDNQFHSCASGPISYSGLGAGSTLSIVRTSAGPVELDTLSLPAAPAGTGGTGGVTVTGGDHLAETGTDVSGPVVGGTVAIGAGLLLVLAARRRRRGAHA